MRWHVYGFRAGRSFSGGVLMAAGTTLGPVRPGWGGEPATVATMACATPQGMTWTGDCRSDGHSWTVAVVPLEKDGFHSSKDTA